MNLVSIVYESLISMLYKYILWNAFISIIYEGILNILKKNTLINIFNMNVLYKYILHEYTYKYTL